MIKVSSLPAAATPDLFHRYLDVRMRAARGLGNGSQFLFELDGELDADILRGRLATLAETVPLLTAGLGPWPAVRWAAVPSHEVPVREEPVGGTVDAWFSRWFGEPFAPLQTPSVEFVLGRVPGRTAVLVRWLHTLADAPGMDLLCRMLDGEDPARFKLDSPPGALVRRAQGGTPWLRRALDVHRLAVRHLLRSIPPPFQAPIDRQGRQGVQLETLNVQETSQLWGRAGELSGLDRNAFLLGALARAAVRAWSPSPWRSLRIPVPVSLRPPAWCGPVLGNWFTMVLLQVPVRRLGSLEQSVETCRDAWRAALGRGEDRATMALMEPARVLPPVLARLFLDGPALRDGATVNTSWVELKTGASGTWLGLPVLRGAMASSILAPPGLAGVFSSCAGRLSVAVPGQGGASAESLHRELLLLLRGGVE